MTVIKFKKYVASIEENTVSVMSDDSNLEILCPYLRVTKATINEELNTESYLIEYFRRGTNELTKQWIKYDVLLPNGVLSLTQYGVNIPINNKNQVSDMLLASLDIAEYTIQIKKYGWQTIEGVDAFIANEIYSAQTLKGHYETTSTTIDTSSNGTWNNWKGMYDGLVRGYSYLELAVVMGLSAPVLNYIGNYNNPDIKSIIIHLCGDSTTGKSTATMLALSTCGNPNTGSNTLLRYWSGTVTSTMSSLKEVNGIPIGLDELSTQKDDSLTSLIYSLAEGIDRARSDVDGSLKKTSTWQTVIISNGELSIFNKVSNNTGIRTRLFEFNNTSWTDNAKQADSIKSVVQINYGLVLPKFIDGLLDLGLDTLTETYNSEVDRLNPLFPNSRLKQRILNKLAIFTTTAQLLNKLEILEVDIDGITEILITQERKSIETRDLSEMALNCLFQYLIAHPKSLEDDTNLKVGKQVDDKTVFIYSKQLEDILHENKYEDFGVIMKCWAKSGFIIKQEKDRLKARTTIASSRVDGYYISIPDIYIDYFRISPIGIV